MKIVRILLCLSFILFGFALTIIAQQQYQIVLEAEEMEIKTGGSLGQYYWLLDENAYIATTVEFPETREYSFKILVFGIKDYDEWPFMEIRVDNLVSGPIIVDNNTSWDYYEIVNKVAAGQHQIAVAFVNDKGNRKLYIDKVVITYSEVSEYDRLIQLANSIILKRPDPQNYSITDWTIMDVMYGMTKTYETTGDTKYLNYIKTWIDNHIDENGNLDIPITGSIPGMIIVWLYDVTGESKYLKAVEAITDFMLNDYPRTTNNGFVHMTHLVDQLWIDTIGSHGLLWGHTGHVTGNNIYFNEGITQVVSHLSLLQDVNTGLVYHGWDEDGSAQWANLITHCSPNFWARGNGWAIRGLTDFLEFLPDSNPAKSEIINRLQNLVDGIVQFQDVDSGLWFTVTDQGGNYKNYFETTASALFVYGIQKAIKFGWINNSYQEYVNKAKDALNRKIYIDGDNNVIVTGISGITGVGDYDYYVNIPVRTGDDYSYGEGVFLQTKALIAGNFNSSTYSISGNALYYSNGNKIKDVNVTVSGGQSVDSSTDIDGHYFIQDLQGSQSYNVKAEKLANTDFGDFTITAYDAALTAQTAVGIRTLAAYETIAADVSKDGQVYTFDAALIAHYSVGLPQLPTSHVGEWEFVPESINYESLNSDQADQNFIGIILGNVHGGWIQPGTFEEQSIIYDKLTNITAQPGEEIIIPLEISSNQGVLSAGIDFIYNPKVLSFNRIDRTELSQDMEIFCNNESGRLRLGVFGVEPINDSGVLINLRFFVIAKNSIVSELLLNRFQLNDNIIMKAKVNLIVMNEVKLPLNYNLENNYPNPFIPGGGFNVSKGVETVINYQLPRTEEICIKIYNFLGQEMRTLVNAKKEPGTYKVYWDGRNNEGEYVSSGVYLYRFVAGNYVQTKRMLILR